MDLDQLAQKVEDVQREVREYLAEHPSPVIRNGLNQSEYLLDAINRERHASREAPAAAKAAAAAEPKYDQHEIKMTALFVRNGTLPEGSTPAAFREWQEKRQAEMRGIPSVAEQQRRFEAGK